jgi:hypothetical protein
MRFPAEAGVGAFLHERASKHAGSARARSPAAHGGDGTPTVRLSQVRLFNADNSGEHPKPRRQPRHSQITALCGRRVVSDSGQTCSSTPKSARRVKAGLAASTYS